MQQPVCESKLFNNVFNDYGFTNQISSICLFIASSPSSLVGFGNILYPSTSNSIEILYMI